MTTHALVYLGPLNRRAERLVTDPVPWSSRRVLSLALVLAVAFGGLVLCWFGVSGESRVSDQIPWLAVAVLCTVISGAGIASWIAAGMRAVHHAARDIKAALRTGYLEPVEAQFGRRPDLARTRPAAAASDGSYVVGGGMTNVHRPNCLLLVGKSVHPVEHDSIDRGEFGRCRMCCG